MRDYFKGYYCKHQKEKETVSLIVGQSKSEKFIQVITADQSVKVPFTEGNVFSGKGIILDIQTPELSLKGKIRYGKLTPVCYDIMGPFRFLPMECSHGIISMYHRLEGKVCLNEKTIDFTGGIGYIEKDCGCSFPSSYVWVQANDFKSACSIMAAVARIPFGGLHFRGCICVIWYHGREYRMATYLGARVLACSPECIIIRQGKYRLEIRVKACEGQSLSAPQNGEMTRTIVESVSCPAEFVLYKDGECVLRQYSNHASFEYEKEKRR